MSYKLEIKALQQLARDEALEKFNKFLEVSFGRVLVAGDILVCDIAPCILKVTSVIYYNGPKLSVCSRAIDNTHWLATFEYDRCSEYTFSKTDIKQFHVRFATDDEIRSGTRCNKK